MNECVELLADATKFLTEHVNSLYWKVEKVRHKHNNAAFEYDHIVPNFTSMPAALENAPGYFKEQWTSYFQKQKLLLPFDIFYDIEFGL